MTKSTCLASTCESCRYCRYFTPEGRRGGYCEQLGVPVQSKWKACMLALPPFAPSWETLEQSITWQPQPLMIKEELTMTKTWSVNVAEFKNADTLRPSYRRQSKVSEMVSEVSG